MINIPDNGLKQPIAAIFFGHQRAKNRQRG